MFRVVIQFVDLQMTEAITNLCIVADIYRCPPKYELVIIYFIRCIWYNYLVSSMYLLKNCLTF